jgi:hypothetical protein
MLASVSLLAIQPSHAQAIPKPSAPDFTLKYVDRSYTVPANYTYKIDPYTGEQIRTGNGEYRVDNQTIELTIKNQPIAGYKDPSTQTNYQLCYNVSWKGYYEDTWHYYGLYMSEYTDYSGAIDYGHKASQSDYTTFLFGFGTDRVSTESMLNLGILPNNSKVDFRVQALFGYYTGFMDNWVPGFRPSYAYKFTGQTSDWSTTQTIAIPSANSSPAPSSPVIELSVIVFASLLSAILLAILVIKIKRRKRLGIV